MEDRTALAFAGLINQIRQEDLGIERYIWVTQGDHKVRPSHAALDGETFRWDDPSGEGHPGQAPNCRCRAVPLPDNAADVVLANYTVVPEALGDGGSTVIRSAIAAIGRLLSVSPLAAGTFLTALLYPTPAGDPGGEETVIGRMEALDHASQRLGLYLQDPAAFMAGVAYLIGAEDGFGAAETPGEIEVSAQAAALYELASPGATSRLQNGDPDAQAAFTALIAGAVQAYRDGRLSLTPDGWAQGWIEVFPGLDEDERRLGELPGFTAEQQDAFILADPLLDDGFPGHTGHAPEADPVGNVISTPPIEAFPNAVTIENPHSIDSVSIAKNRERHILDGDQSGGEHRYGTGIPGKTEFPAN